MGKIINLQDYKKLKTDDCSMAAEINWEEFFKEQERYDSFFDYEGEMICNAIKSGDTIDKETLDRWHCKDEQEFLDTWRGNSDEEYHKWLKENGYE